eukprot:COSAG03_NODE_550_length_6983_cov_1023.581493_4_plen_240_part_00
MSPSTFLAASARSFFKARLTSSNDAANSRTSARVPPPSPPRPLPLPMAERGQLFWRLQEVSTRHRRREPTCGKISGVSAAAHNAHIRAPRLSGTRGTPRQPQLGALFAAATDSSSYRAECRRTLPARPPTPRAPTRITYRAAPPRSLPRGSGRSPTGGRRIAGGGASPAAAAGRAEMINVSGRAASPSHRLLNDRSHFCTHHFLLTNFGSSAKREAVSWHPHRHDEAGFRGRVFACGWE